LEGERLRRKRRWRDVNWNWINVVTICDKSKQIMLLPRSGVINVNVFYPSGYFPS
jgi:hypothetical protein